MAAVREPTDLYGILGLTKHATGVEIRRTYRTLVTRYHPDKTGPENAELFQAIQHAYEVLSDSAKRQLYDATGTWEKGAEEELLESFAGGNFKDRVRGPELSRPALDALIAKQRAPGHANSHTSGFEAWLRSRGEEQGSLFNAETVAEVFGVTRSSYTAVPLPAAEVCTVKVMRAGRPSDVMVMTTERLVPALEWGCVCVEWRYAPINPGDIYSAKTGGTYGSDSTPMPYVGGHDGVGVVAKVGPGVKSLSEGDVVLPAHTFMGTWQSACGTVKENDLIRLPPHLTALITDRAMDLPASQTESSGVDEKDGGGAAAANTNTTSKAGFSGSGRVGMEMLAMSREMGLAYLLLEKHGNLKAGDCVLMNAATSMVGQALLQLCKLLKLRAVAVARPPSAIAEAGNELSAEAEEAWARTEAWLKSLGATIVVKDQASVKVALDSLQFFGRPKLALDAVGGQSAARLVEALAEGGEVVCYGCASGKAPQWTWQGFVFRELKVTGFNMRRWMSGGSGGGVLASNSAAATASKRFLPVLESLMKLMDAGLLTVAYTEYDLQEFSEALDHALSPGRCSKVLLRMPPMSVMGSNP